MYSITKTVVPYKPGQISTFSFYHCENDFQHEKTKTLTIPQHHRLPEAWFFSQHHLNYNQLKTKPGKELCRAYEQFK